MEGSRCQREQSGALSRKRLLPIGGIQMKRMLFVLGFTVIMLFSGVGVSSGEVVNAVWQVNSLVDDSGAPIRFLDLDMQLGIDWIAAHGGLIFDDGAGTCAGTGNFAGNGLYFSLNLQSYFAIVYIDFSTLGGTIDLYKMGETQELIDSGTLVFQQAR